LFKTGWRRGKREGREEKYDKDFILGKQILRGNELLKWMKNQE